MKSLFLCIYHDGNNIKACLLDFGSDDVSWGPYGNEHAIRAALCQSEGAECSINALVDWSDKSDLSDRELSEAADQVIVDDESLETLKIIKVARE